MDEPIESPSFSDLPDKVLEPIFRYLSYEDLFRIGRTCRNLYFLSRDARFWKHVDTGDINVTTMDYNRIKMFLPVLPSGVTHLKLRFIPCSEEKLTLPELFLPIKRRCPGLQVLVLHHGFLSYAGQTNLDFCIFDHLPASVRVFACQKGELETINFLTNKKSKLIYPLLVLDLSASVIQFSQTFFDIFERMPNLRELRLANCSILDEDIMRIDSHVMSNLRILDLEGAVISQAGFAFIRKWCTTLEELYVCGSGLSNDDVQVDAENHFERLEILCLRKTAVTDTGIARILHFCDTLRFVYVSYDSQLRRLTTLPESIRNKISCRRRQNSCEHYSKRNYMRDIY